MGFRKFILKHQALLLVFLLAVPFILATCHDDDDEPAIVTPPGASSSTNAFFVEDNASLLDPNTTAFTFNNTYFLAKSAAFPNGEIRGQIDKTPTIIKFASLDGAQESPPTGSTAKGAGVLGFNAADNSIAGFVITTGVTATAAHIHIGGRGDNGAIIVTLVGGPNTWCVPDNTVLLGANAAAFLADNLYYNVHSAAFPNGEIRGQIDKTPTVRKFASLDGAQEVPSVTTNARGFGVLGVDQALVDNNISGFIITTNITATAAHVHLGDRGIEGPIAVTLVGGPTHWFIADNATLPADNVTAFLGDNTYYNVHSTAFPDGQIRGQLDKTPNLTKFAALDNVQVVPPTTSAAKGCGLLGFDGTLLTNNLCGFVVTSGMTPTDVEIYSGNPTVNGGLFYQMVPAP